MINLRFINSSKVQNYVVIVIESTFVNVKVITYESYKLTESIEHMDDWDCSKYLSDNTGKRLFEEIFRKLAIFIEKIKIKLVGVAISVPGTLKDNSTILSSKRLGIHQPINVTALYQQTNNLPCYIFHDTECMGLGEAKFGNTNSNDTEKANFAYIFVDEGVGSTLFIDGKPFKGKGSAGHIGRLVLDPRGQYNPTFSSRGSLEVFAARPWVSSNIIGLYLAEKDKDILINKEGDQEFRNFIQTASERKELWPSLPYHVLAKGVESRDPIANSVFEDATIYLGIAINCILAIAHPSEIIIGGGMIKNIPGFFEGIISYARRFSWALAWNRTTIRIATLDRSAQFFGAAEMLKDQIKQK